MERPLTDPSAITRHTNTLDKVGNRTQLDEVLAEIGAVTGGLITPGAQPNSFAPSVAQSTTITWTGTPMPHYTVTIKTSDGTTARTLTNALPSANVVWDGKDTGGTIQPPGTYTATLSAAGQTDQTVNITLTRQASATYSYDQLYRLTQATNPWAGTTYSYDPVGNRLTSVIAGASSSYTSDKVDRLTQVGSVAYTNDANGNRTGRGSDTFTYDLANCLTQAALSGGSTTNYAYDGDGKRMCSSTPCTTPEYVYDVNRGLPVILQDGTKQYVWGQGLAYTVNSTNIAVHYTDGLGSTRAVTTASGQVESSYLTDDFGVSKLIRGASPARMQYTGEPRDGETGFVYLRARIYDPGVGRFLQRDTYGGKVTSPRSLNRFVYVGNNPCSRVDPSGRKAQVNQQCSAGALPDVPDGVDRDQLFGELKAEALHMRAAAATQDDPASFIQGWLVTRFKPGAHWDVKNRGRDGWNNPTHAPIGNFLFGMAAAFVGVTKEYAQWGAGIAQQMQYALDSVRHWKGDLQNPPRQPDGPHGDYLEDEECISLGYDYATAELTDR